MTEFPVIIPQMFVVGLYMVAAGVYAIPSVIAITRQHNQKIPITALNFLLGWTFLGWVGAFVWSVTPTERTNG